MIWAWVKIAVAMATEPTTPTIEEVPDPASTLGEDWEGSTEAGTPARGGTKKDSASGGSATAWKLPKWTSDFPPIRILGTCEARPERPGPPRTLTARVTGLTG